MPEFITDTIGSIPGPKFLLVYAVVIAVTIAFCRVMCRWSDDSGALPPPVEPDAPDAYEVAYLRGGEPAVARTVIFNLIHRGYVKHIEEKSGWISTKAKLAQCDDHPGRHHLAPIEESLFDALIIPREGKDLFGTAISNQVKHHCAAYAERMTEERLVSAGQPQATLMWMLFGVAVILGLGGIKLAIALSRGRHNVGFLIAMGLISTVVLIVLCRAPRLTKRGREYLERVQEAFSLQRARATFDTSPQVDATLPLLVGLFGVGVLSGTSHGYFNDIFKKSSSGGWSSGCGAGCGSGCGGGCGGGGCGGGCGGCGG